LLIIKVWARLFNEGREERAFLIMRAVRRTGGKRLIEANPEDELAYTSLSIFYQRKGMISEAESIGAKARTLGWKRQLQEKKEEEKKG
jgi:hypothetical protein